MKEKTHLDLRAGRRRRLIEPAKRDDTIRLVFPATTTEHPTTKDVTRKFQRSGSLYHIAHHTVQQRLQTIIRLLALVRTGILSHRFLDPNSARVLFHLTLGRRTDTLSLLDFIKITIKSQLALYNATLLAWREKVCV